MKKENLLVLYNNLSDLSMKITSSLSKLKDLNRDVENDFIDFCVKHKDVIDEDIYDRTLQLFLDISYVIPEDVKKDVYDLLDELYENEYITSSEDFSIVLENLLELLIIPISEIIDVYKLIECDCNVDNITFDIFKIYIEQFKSIRKLPYNKMYSQSIAKINKNFLTMLHDLNNTDSDINEDLYLSYFNRIDSYMQIIRNPEIYSMSPKSMNLFVKVPHI